jgi:hypothetical protein
MDKKEPQESCPHPSFTQERNADRGSGDYHCDRCGKTFLFSEIREMSAKRQAAETRGRAQTATAPDALGAAVLPCGC